MQDRGLSSSCLCVLYIVCAGACVSVSVWNVCVRICMYVVFVHVCGCVVYDVCMCVC